MLGCKQTAHDHRPASTIRVRELGSRLLREQGLGVTALRALSFLPYPEGIRVSIKECRYTHFDEFEIGSHALTKTDEGRRPVSLDG